MPRQGSHWLYFIDEADYRVFSYQYEGHPEESGAYGAYATIATVVGPVTRRKGRAS